MTQLPSPDHREPFQLQPDDGRSVAPPVPAPEPEVRPQDCQGQAPLFCQRCGAGLSGDRRQCARCGAPCCVGCGES